MEFMQFTNTKCASLPRQAVSTILNILGCIVSLIKLMKLDCSSFYRITPFIIVLACNRVYIPTLEDMLDFNHNLCGVLVRNMEMWISMQINTNSTVLIKISVSSFGTTSDITEYLMLPLYHYYGITSV